MNGLGHHQSEGPAAGANDFAWPSAVDAAKVFIGRWKTFAASVGAMLLVAFMALRVIPKSYESVAVVSTKGSDIQNPASNNNTKFKAFEREKLALDELRSTLFSYDIVKKAAEESGVSLNTALSTSESFKRLLWNMAGGEISTDPAARERVAMDVLRFNHFTFGKLDARATQDRNVEKDNNTYIVGMQYGDPHIARLFLQRTLELYRDKLAKEQAEANDKLSKIYEELSASMGKNIESLQGSPKVARQKLQTMDVLKDQLKAKLNEESMLRNTSEQELALLRKDVVEAEARYSDKHPTVEALRRKFAEGSARAKSPIARVQAEIASIRAQLSSSFSELLQASQGTFESSSINTEGHSEQFTKDRRELRSASNVFENMRERYLEIIVQERISRLANESALQIIEPASLPLRPKNPSMTKILLLGLVAGMFVGFLAVFGKEIVEPTVRNRWVLALRTRLPVLGEQKMSLNASLTMISESESRAAAHPASRLRRNLKRITGKSKIAKRDEGAEDAASLALLVTKLASLPRPYEGVFQCGLMPLSPETPSAGVAYAIAQQLMQKSAGRARVVIVAANRKDGILDILENKPEYKSEHLLICDSGIAIYDATNASLDSELLKKLIAQGFQHIIWDLPGHETLAWRSLDLPRMPLLGVVEYGEVRYSQITDSAQWLRLMTTENGYTTGLFVAGTVAIPKVKLIEYISDKVA